MKQMITPSVTATGIVTHGIRENVRRRRGIESGIANPYPSPLPPHDSFTIFQRGLVR